MATLRAPPPWSPECLGVLRARSSKVRGGVPVTSCTVEQRLRLVEVAVGEELEERLHVFGRHLLAHLGSRLLVGLTSEAKLASQHPGKRPDAVGGQQRLGSAQPVGATVMSIRGQRSRGNSADVVGVDRRDADAGERRRTTSPSRS